jgi:hypothetical protein
MVERSGVVSRSRNRAYRADPGADLTPRLSSRQHIDAPVRIDGCAQVAFGFIRADVALAHPGYVVAGVQP